MLRTREILVVAFEFADPIFSGNGTYGRTVVEGLCQHHSASHKEEGSCRHLKVSVLTASPLHKEACRIPFRFGDTAHESTSFDVTLLCVPVGMDRWRSLDITSDWQVFADRGDELFGNEIRAKTPRDDNVCGGEEGRYHSVFVVDWHGANAWFRCCGGLSPSMPVVYLNFRVFANRALLPAGSEMKNDDEVEDFQAYLGMECEAVLRCSATVALCVADEKLLIENCMMHVGQQHAVREQLTVTEEELARKLSVVLPPVRTAVLEHARHAETGGEAWVLATLPTELRDEVAQGSKFLVCCVRQARDKRPDWFVELVERMMCGKRLPRHIVPLFFGSTPDSSFSEGLRARLVAACPWSIALTGFVTSEQMVAIFSSSVLNVHPPLYDAYGLTIVEAAVCGCPSLVHASSAPMLPIYQRFPRLYSGFTVSAVDAFASPIGAADLLTPHGAVFAHLDGDPRVDVVDGVLELLSALSEEPVAAVTRVAKNMGRGYDTMACGQLIWSSAAKVR